MDKLEKRFREKYGFLDTLGESAMWMRRTSATEIWEWIENNCVAKDEMWEKFNNAIITTYEQNKKIEELENQLKAIRRDINWIKI